MRRYVYLTGILFFTLNVSHHAQAKTDISFHGTVVNLSCKVTDEQAIEIQFGNEVVADLIDGQRYMQGVPLKISCNKDYSGDLNFSIMGIMSSFENTALETNVAGLGIRLLDAKTNQPLEINNPYIHKNNDDVEINVVPVKEKNADLQGGEFYATARLLVEPQ